jgi:hypothetical protein
VRERVTVVDEQGLHADATSSSIAAISRSVATMRRILTPGEMSRGIGGAVRDAELRRACPAGRCRRSRPGRGGTFASSAIRARTGVRRASYFFRSLLPARGALREHDDDVALAAEPGVAVAIASASACRAAPETRRRRSQTA